MDHIDPSGSANRRIETISAAEAARRLGVKLATLYSYVSRGFLRRVPGPDGRERRYVAEDVERLRARHDARSGRGPVATGALRWGEPVLETSISRIDPEKGPVYRGHGALELARRRVSYERVAQLLWTGALEDELPFSVPARAFPASRLAPLVPSGTRPLDVIQLALPLLATGETFRFSPARPVELERARRIVRLLAAAAGLAHGVKACEASLRADSMAEAALLALGGSPSGAALRAVNEALVLVADHELNASSFAARVAAGVGADLYACVGAALSVLSGPLHGGMCDRVEALAAEAGDPKRAAAAVAERTRRGEAVPGFGHPLYPDGDPRTPPLLDAAKKLAPKDARVRTLLAIAEAMDSARLGRPTVDFGLVSLCFALGLRPGSAAALFAIGRSAAWVAHALEQRDAGFQLRPRARYVGP